MARELVLVGHFIVFFLASAQPSVVHKIERGVEFRLLTCKIHKRQHKHSIRFSLSIPAICIKSTDM